MPNPANSLLSSLLPTLIIGPVTTDIINPTSILEKRPTIRIYRGFFLTGTLPKSYKYKKVYLG